ncbi:MAG: hypothetical protein K2Z81_17865, partial [Cyanobacteria bacterium]|nr:hypothetical protein [Cyanobacteriota bacterium]
MQNWPTPQDYNEAIQATPHCFSDPDLKTGVVAVNAMGIPKVASGAFASVYKVTNKDRTWAVRFFHSNRPEQKERYRHISDFVLFDNLESTVDFYYLDEGIRVRGDWYPCLKMIWVEGQTLDRYIEENYRDKKRMARLLKDFHTLVGELEGAGIGHCDLQHGNIIVTNEGLRLVDYDALFVPALLGKTSLEFGHPNYQHPRRLTEHYDQDVDNFSCWLIHASLLALAIDPALFKTLSGGDDSILFKRKDLEHPETSAVFKTLLGHESAHIRDTASVLLRMLWAEPTAIPYLGAPVHLLDVLPTKRPDDLPPDGDNGSRGSEAKVDSISQPEIKTSSAHSATVDAFGLTDTKQERRRRASTQLRKSLRAAFDKGRKARDKVLKAADRIQQGAVPQDWFHKHYRRAEDHYHDGEYDKAIEVLSRLFKSLSDNYFQIENRSYHRYQVPMMLGYCHALNGTTGSLAGNYFLTALNAAKDECPHWKRTAKSTLLLALSKYEDGDQKAAWRTLDSYRQNISTGLASLINSMDEDPLIFRISTFKMLKSFVDQLPRSPENLPMALELLTATSEVFLRLTISCSDQIDDDAINSFIDVLRFFYQFERFDRAQSGFLILASYCKDHGFPDQTKLSLFCGALLVQQVNGSKQEPLELLAELGKIDADELLRIATASSTYFPAPQVIELILTIADVFKMQGDKHEHMEALRVACQFAVGSKQGNNLIAMALEREFRPDIIYCLEQSYLKDTCSSSDPDLTHFVVAVGRIKCVKVLACILGILAQRKDLQSIAVLLHYVAGYTDKVFLTRVLDRELNLLSKEELIDALTLSARACFVHLDNALAEEKGSPTAARATLDVLDNLRSASQENRLEQLSELILKAIVSEKYLVLLCDWAKHLVDVRDYDRLYKLAQEMADKHYVEALKLILVSLIEADRTAVVDGIAKVLNNDLRQQSLVALTIELSAERYSSTFAILISELARTATGNLLVAVIDRSFGKQKTMVPSTNLAAIIKTLIRHGRVSELSSVLSHCHRNCGLVSLPLVIEDLMNATSLLALFLDLAEKEDFPTVGELIRYAVLKLSSSRINQIFQLFRWPTVPANSLYLVLAYTIAECNKDLDTLLKLVNRETSIDGGSDSK